MYFIQSILQIFFPVTFFPSPLLLFFLLLFFQLLFFLLPHCYFLSCYFFSCYFFSCYFFSVTFFPVTFFPTIVFWGQPGSLKISMLKSMLPNKDFLTWLLTYGWSSKTSHAMKVTIRHDCLAMTWFQANAWVSYDVKYWKKSKKLIPFIFSGKWNDSSMVKIFYTV